MKSTICGVLFAVLLTLCALLPACSSIGVRKVPNKSDYSVWGDKQQRHADNIRGFRYYLPRPYVVVKQEFPVAGGDFFIQGTVDPSGEVVEIDTTNLNDSVKNALGLAADSSTAGRIAISTAAILVEPDAALDADRSQQQAGGTSSDAEAGAPTAATPDTGTPATGKESIKAEGKLGAVVTPGTLPKDGKDVSATATLAGDAPFKTVDSVAVVLVPFGKDEAALPEKAVKMVGTKVVKAFEAGKTAGEYSAVIDRRLLAEAKSQYFSVGLEMTVQVEEGDPKKDVVFYRTSPDLTVLGVETASAPDGKAEDKKGEDNSGVKVATSGDPTTSPFIKLEGNTYFDVLLMPDFEEQYSIRTHGIKQSANLGFENGWMVERVNYEIDNTKLMEFLGQAAQTAMKAAGAGALGGGLSDAAGAAGKLAKAIALKQVLGKLRLPAQQAGGAGVAPEQAVTKEILLHVTWRADAVPGLYPLLKLDEEYREHAMETPENVQIPFRPYTVIAFNVRRSVSITAVNVRQESPRAEKPKNDEERDNTLTHALMDAYKEKTLKDLPDGIACTYNDDERSVVVTGADLDEAEQELLTSASFREAMKAKLPAPYNGLEIHGIRIGSDSNGH